MPTSSHNEIAHEILLKLLRTMLLIRKFEEKIIDVYPDQDMKTPVHLCIGQEAVAAGVCANLVKDDYLFTTHRSHGHCLAKGADPGKLFAEFYGRIDGYCKGKGGSMHFAVPEIGIMGTSAIVGGGIPLGVGTALASRMKGDGKISAVFFGDGAVDEGVFHESLNFASLKKLPVIFVCENNFYSVNSHISKRQPHDNIAKRAQSYEMPGIQINGNDVVAVYRASEEAVNRIKNKDGPTLIECRTYRWKEHVGYDCDYEKGCRPKEELIDWVAKCPVESFKKKLIEEGLLSEESFRTISEKMDADLTRAMKWAKKSPYPDKETVLSDVYFGKV